MYCPSQPPKISTKEGPGDWFHCSGGRVKRVQQGPLTLARICCQQRTTGECANQPTCSGTEVVMSRVRGIALFPPCYARVHTPSSRAILHVLRIFLVLVVIRLLTRNRPKTNPAQPLVAVTARKARLPLEARPTASFITAARWPPRRRSGSHPRTHPRTLRSPELERARSPSNHPNTTSRPTLLSTGRFGGFLAELGSPNQKGCRLTPQPIWAWGPVSYAKCRGIAPAWGKWAEGTSGEFLVL